MTSKAATIALANAGPIPTTGPHQESAPKQRRPRLEQLDGLRGILALFVVVYHLQDPFPLVSGPLLAHLPIVSQAWYSVDVFFIMSGFVMMYVYGAAFADKVRWADYRAFFTARIARLYPVHLFAMAILLLALLPFIHGKPDFTSIDGRYSWNSALAALFMLHGPWIDHRTWNFPSWSISAEWHAYVIFPFVAVLASRWSPRLSALIVTVCCAGALLLYNIDTHTDQYPTNTPVVLLRVLPLFIAGMALFRLNLAYGHFLSARWSIWAVIAALLILLSVPAIASLSVLLAPVLVLAALHCPGASLVFSNRPALFLGRISYSLYMTHALVSIVGISLWLKEAPLHFGIDPTTQLASWLCFLAAVVAALVFGWLTFRFIEVPFRKTILRRLV
jgi:peptidoglycan/LPS O-acetylase OafA/YrhL